MVTKKVDEDPKPVPVTEMVISMAPAFFSREQVLDMIKEIDAAKAKGLKVRFA
jgi:hypothetical protein